MSEPLIEAELQEIETRAFSFGARQDIPRLIASLREARRERDDLKRQLDEGARDTEQIALVNAILLMAPQAPAHHAAIWDWLNCYREWWMRRIPGTAAILDSREAPHE